MGGAQPLAITMNKGTALVVEIDPVRLQRRLEIGYLDEAAADLDDALDRAERARHDRRAVSIGVVGNAADVFPEISEAGIPRRRRDRSDLSP